MKREGYLWNCYGFTRLHMWGVHIVSGAFAAVGTYFFVIAIYRRSDYLPESLLVLLKYSGIAFLGCIATVAISILTLLFFWGAHHMGLLGAKSDDEE